MHKLPVETLQQIFDCACTDGGYTGCSLSLVSKHIRAASRTSRFHSILLIANPRRLRSFLTLYKRECDPTRGDPPHVRHLHVTFPRVEQTRLPPSRSPLRMDDASTTSSSMARGGRSYTESASRPWTSNSSTRTGFRSYLPIEPVKGTTTLPEYPEAARSLFRLLSPELVSLVVQCGSSLGGQELPVIRYPFPCLREVTLVGAQRPRMFFSPESQAPLFPVATYLYIVAPLAGPCDLELSFWASIAPHIVNLGVSRAEGHVNELASAVGTSLSMYALSSQPPLEATYPSVRRLAMQASAPPNMRGLSTDREHVIMQHENQVRDLRRLTRQAKFAGVEAFLVDEPAESSYNARAERITREWRLRMEGGVGIGWAGVQALLSRRRVAAAEAARRAQKRLERVALR